MSLLKLINKTDLLNHSYHQLYKLDNITVAVVYTNYGQRNVLNAFKTIGFGKGRLIAQALGLPDVFGFHIDIAFNPAVVASDTIDDVIKEFENATFAIQVTQNDEIQARPPK